MTDRYAVIGNPISHSKSPEIHTMFAEQFKGKPAGDMIYKDRILGPLDSFSATIERLRSEGYKGCNVTVPFKQAAFQLRIINITMSHSEDVDNAKAANTLKFLDDKIEVANTDGVGLVRDIEQNLGIKLKEKRVLLIGAGGAARGVLLPLRRAGANITITNRTIDKAHHLAKHFPVPVSSCSFEELAEKQFDIIINATSSGLTDEMPDIPKNIFAPGSLAYDMMYGKETPFMAFAHANGATIVADGLGMLVEQAAEAFYIWRDKRPATAPVIAALRS